MMFSFKAKSYDVFAFKWNLGVIYGVMCDLKMNVLKFNDVSFKAKS